MNCHKGILSFLKHDVMEGAGSLQLCGGQIADIEAAIRTVRSAFGSELEDSQGVLLQ